MTADKTKEADKEKNTKENPAKEKESGKQKDTEKFSPGEPEGYDAEEFSTD